MPPTTDVIVHAHEDNREYLASYPFPVLTTGDLEHLIGRLHPDGCALCNRIGPELITHWADSRGGRP